MSFVHLLPPNLGAMGYSRATPDDEPDLITIYRTPYPVLRRYQYLCKDLRIKPYAGGTHEKQGVRQAGYILSGYRQEVVEGRENSPHRFAFAIDVITGDIQLQAAWAVRGQLYFPRIGLYPFNNFMHFDLASPEWINHYAAARFWVRDQSGAYHVFKTLKDTIGFAREITR